MKTNLGIFATSVNPDQLRTITHFLLFSPRRFQETSEKRCAFGSNSMESQTDVKIRLI